MDVLLVSDFDLYGPNSTFSSMQSDLRSTSGDFARPATGWINTVPLSSSSNTLSKRSARSKRIVNADVFVKDYMKKRNLILELLVSIEYHGFKMFLVYSVFKFSNYINEVIT
jgi:phosphatidylinositol 4-kinase